MFGAGLEVFPLFIERMVECSIKLHFLNKNADFQIKLNQAKLFVISDQRNSLHNEGKAIDSSILIPLLALTTRPRRELFFTKQFWKHKNKKKFTN